MKYPSRHSVLLLVLFLIQFHQPCFAHTTGLSSSSFTFGTNGVDAAVILAGTDLRLALQQVQSATPFDQNRDGTLNDKELAESLDRVRKFAGDCLVLQFDERPVQPTVRKLSIDDQDTFHIELNYPGNRPALLRVRAALFAQLPPDHLHFVSVRDLDGSELGKKMLNPGDDSLAVVCPTGNHPTEQPASSFTDFLMLGVKHIWTGYDHLLFLLALLFVCRDFKSAAQVVTFFTIAHSITLAFATLNMAWISSRAVEPMIAASIVYVGLENLLRPDGPKGRWLITFLFGLIHGFGFASVLKDLGVASNTTGLAMPLIGFNLGVEVGQIVIAGVLLPIIWQLRKSELFLRRGVPIGSGLVAAMGMFWLCQRLFFTP